MHYCIIKSRRRTRQVCRGHFTIDKIALLGWMGWRYMGRGLSGGGGVGIVWGILVSLVVSLPSLCLVVTCLVLLCFNVEPH